MQHQHDLMIFHPSVSVMYVQTLRRRSGVFRGQLVGALELAFFDSRRGPLKWGRSDAQGGPLAGSAFLFQLHPSTHRDVKRPQMMGNATFGLLKSRFSAENWPLPWRKVACDKAYASPSKGTAAAMKSCTSCLPAGEAAFPPTQHNIGANHEAPQMHPVKVGC